MQTFLKWIKRISLLLAALVILIIAAIWIRYYFWEQAVIAELPQDTQIAETELGSVEYNIIGESRNFILISHGTPGSAHVGKDFAKQQLQNGYSTILVSRPGYYGTPLSSGESPAHQADLFAALLDTLSIESTHVWAISGGGPAGIEFALRHPERTQSLVLYTAATGKGQIPEQSPLEKLLMKSDLFVWTYFQIALRTSQDEAFRERGEKYLRTAFFPLDSVRDGMTNDTNQLHDLFEPELEQVAVPTLILHGENDRNIPYSTAQKAAERIPSAQLITFAGRDHFNVLTANDSIKLERVNHFLEMNSSVQDAQETVCQSQPTDNCKADRLSVNGIEMYYEIHGNGPPLLILHGGTGFIESFASQIVPLSQHFTVIAPDSRAHGRTSDTDVPLSYDLMADDFKQLLDHLNITSTRILGWSDGGNTGLTMALKYPDYVEQLAIIGSNFHTDGLYDEMKEALKQTDVSQLDPRIVVAYQQMSPTPERLSVFWEKLRTMWLNHPTLTTTQLQTIAAPTFVIAGANEEFIKESHSRKLADAIPSAQLELIDEGTHYVPLEQPELITTLLLDFYLAQGGDSSRD